ncbi:UNVERIFIED_CONTAM: hypothetical protein Slati_3013500 [Sesamum latifolium]|uniref:Retrotransposon gag domain-containing protein n=1 Tax=Sesamum latifolium TaxID=2727402 RepID=A0AAW2VJJ9_9LAMI
MKIALGAKVKLGFINGSCAMSAENDGEYADWKRVDCMVISWLLNSISKDIVDAFLYMSSARELWKELEERFGECKWPPTIPDSERDKFDFIRRFNRCCVLHKIEKTDAIFMDLDENYDHIRNQILLMEPLPSVNKPYSMVLRVEKQREESCFKLIGYPDWYKELRDKKKKNIPNPHANTVGERFESDDGSKHPTDWKETVNIVIQRELQKLMKGRGSGEENALNYAHM